MRLAETISPQQLLIGVRIIFDGRWVLPTVCLGSVGVILPQITWVTAHRQERTALIPSQYFSWLQNVLSPACLFTCLIDKRHGVENVERIIVQFFRVNHVQPSIEQIVGTLFNDYPNFHAVTVLVAPVQGENIELLFSPINVHNNADMSHPVVGSHDLKSRRLSTYWEVAICSF